MEVELKPILSLFLLILNLTFGESKICEVNYTNLYCVDSEQVPFNVSKIVHSWGNVSTSTELTEDEEDDILHRNHGYLALRRGSEILYWKSEDFCSFSNESTAGRLCNHDCERRTCIQKCCLLHQSLDLRNTQPACVDHDDDPGTSWSPKRHHSHDIMLTDTEHSTTGFHFLLNFDCAEESIMSIMIRGSSPVENRPDLRARNFRILKSGAISYETVDGTVKIVSTNDEDSFCIDSVVGSENELMTKDGTAVREAIFYCHNSHKQCQPNESLPVFVYFIIFPFSLIFLCLTLTVFILLWDKQNIHGYNVFCYVLSFSLFLAVILIRQIIVKLDFHLVNKGFCTFIGVLGHFLFISMFCWMTVINFDIWWTFKCMYAGAASKSLKQLALFALFSISVPGLVVIVGSCLDKFDSSSDEAPRYTQTCLVSQKSRGWLVYLPAGLLFLLNIMFYLMTLFMVFDYNKSANSTLKGKSTKRNQSQLVLFSKLFIVMGIVWILEFVGWFWNHMKSGTEEEKENGDCTSHHWIIAVMDAFNLLQAVAIFYIFVCKQTTYCELWHKHWWLRPLLRVCIFSGCCQVPPEHHRPSFNTRSSTLNRSRKMSSASRKMSNSSVKSYENRHQLKMHESIL